MMTGMSMHAPGHLSSSSCSEWRFAKVDALASPLGREKWQPQAQTMIYTSNHKVSANETNHTRSMEYAAWKVNTGTVTINIIAIYHPLYSDVNQSTNAMFLNNLADIIMKHLMSLSNIVVTGDFILHMDKMDDPDVNLFKDMVQTFGLDCQVDFPTYRSGHTLDLVLTEAIGNIKISTCEPEVFFS